jgi:hypothetical protein
MPEELRFPDGRIEHPDVSHEKHDLSFPWIVGLILGAMGFACVVHYILWVFFLHYTKYQDVVKKSPFTLAPHPDQKLPPEPRLDPLNLKQNIEHANVYDRQKAKEQVLDSLGPTAEKGFVHIPIDRAMDLLASKLPVTKSAPDSLRKRGNGLVDSGAPNSGRMLRKKPPWFER